MNPETPAMSMAAENPIERPAAVAAGGIAAGVGSAPRGRAPTSEPRRERAYQPRTKIPMSAFKAAANDTEPDSPSLRIMKSPAQKHADADPRVFTAYRPATEVPTLPETRTV